MSQAYRAQGGIRQAGPQCFVASAAGLLDAPPALRPVVVARPLARTVSTSRVKPAELSSPQVAYEMVQGALVRSFSLWALLSDVQAGGCEGARQ